jgi:hypothetical protein
MEASGSLAVTRRVWTGGLLRDTPIEGTCVNWTSPDATVGVEGSSDKAQNNAFFDSTATCDQSLHLYCIEN